MIKSDSVSAVLNDKTLKPEFKRVLKSAMKSKTIMDIDPSEMDNFFGQSLDYEARKLRYTNSTQLNYVKAVLKAKIRNKKKVLAIFKGNKETTLDHLNAVWTVILKNVGNVSWSYFLNSRKDNSLYLFMK